MNLFQKSTLGLLGVATTLALFTSSSQADQKWYHGNAFRPVYSADFNQGKAIVYTERGITSFNTTQAIAVVAAPTRDTNGNVNLVGVTSTSDGGQTACTVVRKANDWVVQDWPMVRTVPSYTLNSFGPFAASIGNTVTVSCLLPKASGTLHPAIDQLYVDEV